ncbi:DUF3592 domain-containing protein [Corynebacterium tapiri]|uniref:DUF3592 domain-containing protein n=1 Tax=Corynebacterium tapiri TaxID=1448266 RepID=A0A5C4U4K0_9CORY|nr:DUF3592 domain-containing protein [Corynebacterium tapiri]TNL97273.1 DUF3592 domain-containing protein [Corynebacterium tapiri]
MSALPRPSRATVRRRLRQLVLALAACALLGCVSMVGGAAINDSTIHRNPGRALATVTGQSWLRTSVSYQDETGVYHSPPAGLLYPVGLGEGQNVWVTYAKTNPEIVKVEGRGWSLAIIPALSVAVVSLLIAGLCLAGVNWATRPRTTDSSVTKV